MKYIDIFEMFVKVDFKVIYGTEHFQWSIAQAVLTKHLLFQD